MNVPLVYIFNQISAFDRLKLNLKTFRLVKGMVQTEYFVLAESGFLMPCVKIRITFKRKNNGI